MFPLLLTQSFSQIDAISIPFAIKKYIYLPKKLSEILVRFTGLLLPSLAFLLFIFSWPVEKTDDSLLGLK